MQQKRQRKKESQQKKAEEEEAARKKEEEEKRGYDTGITYNQLARTPDEYKGEKVKFRGKIVQVMEGETEVQLRMAVNGDYDNIVYLAYLKGITDTRVLDGDYITVMGKSAGLLTYKSTMGGNITIPQILVEKLEQ